MIFDSHAQTIRRERLPLELELESHASPPLYGGPFNVYGVGMFGKKYLQKLKRLSHF
jgi:hypothetical protein